MFSVATCSVLRTLLVVIVHGHLGVFASPVPSSSESSPTNMANTKASAFLHSALATFTEPCLGKTKSATECGTATYAHELNTLSIQIKLALEEHNEAYPGATSHCDGPDLPALQSTKVSLLKCDAANNATAHKAIVNLQLFSHFLMSVSTNNAGTQQHLQFYTNITKLLKQLSCPVKCSTGGLNSTNLQTFVQNLQEGDAAFMFRKVVGFFYRTNVDESSFSTYQCFFLKRANETLTNLTTYYSNCSVL